MIANIKNIAKKITIPSDKISKAITNLWDQGAVLKILLGDGAKVVLEGQKVISSKLKNYNFKYPLLEKAIYASTKN